MIWCGYLHGSSPRQGASALEFGRLPRCGSRISKAGYENEDPSLERNGTEKPRVDSEVQACRALDDIEVKILGLVMEVKERTGSLSSLPTAIASVTLRASTTTFAGSDCFGYSNRSQDDYCRRKRVVDAGGKDTITEGSRKASGGRRIGAFVHRRRKSSLSFPENFKTLGPRLELSTQVSLTYHMMHIIRHLSLQPFLACFAVCVFLAMCSFCSSTNDLALEFRDIQLCFALQS